jgi:2'-5' RNA ligase
MPSSPAAVPHPSERLFLALWPDEAQRARLQEHANAWSWASGARRTRAERLHATLHFLGDVAVDKLPALRSGLGVPWDGCKLVLDRAAVWPGGIAVLEASDVPPALAHLHAEVAQRLQALGVPMESRRYRPHVTLARKAFGSRPPTGFLPLAWQVPPSYLLVRSLPGGRGYESVQVFG